MSWLRLDDGFAEDDAVSALSHLAFRVHVVGLGQCARHLTDGRLSAMRVAVVFAIVGTTAKKPLLELEQAGLWRPDGGGGYVIKNYLKWNPSAEQVKAQRSRNADRQAKHRGTNTVSNAVTDGVTAGVTNDAPSHPLPSPVVSELSALPNYVGHEEKLWRTLCGAAGATDKESIGKLERTIRANRCSERDIVCAIDAANGPGVRDRLAVALAELKKRPAERSAA